MGLAEILTKIFVEPCRSAPKSPPPSASPTETKTAFAEKGNNEKTIVEVLPDITNKSVVNSPNQPSPGGKPETHADGFAVNQIRRDAPEGGPKPRVQLEEETNEPIQKLILDVFGFEIHRALNATAWDDRAQALASARLVCEQRDIPATVAHPVFLDACCKLLVVALQDKVMPVYFDGLELLKYLFGSFFDTFQDDSLAQQAVKDNLESLLPIIISKTADRNARSLEGTRQALIFLARCKSVGCSPVMAHLFSPVQNHKERVLIRGRLDLINHVIDEFGFGKSTTITMQLVMGFVRPHLDATDEKVRRAAVEVTVNCYKHKGDRTLKYVTNVKPALMKLLQQRFSEIDRPTKGNRKHAHSAQGLPAVRGKPRKHERPARQCTSQPMMGVGVKPLPHTHAAADVLRDTPELLSMGDQLASPGHAQMGSPLSVQAAPASSLRDEPPNMMGSPLMPSTSQAMLPGSMPEPQEWFKTESGMAGLGMGSNFDEDLDDDLMKEIEAY